MFKYAITGASGFLGKALFKHFRNIEEERILVLLRKGASTAPKVSSYAAIEIDKDLTLPCHYKADVLIHLAWNGVQNAFKNDPLQLDNYDLTKHVCVIAKKLQVKHIVALGSQAEYGVKNRKVNEKESLHPATLYGKEKIRCFNALKDFCKSENIIYHWMRLFSAYGPEDDLSWLIPQVITQFLQDKSPQLTKGEQMWDYLYVDDVIKALIAAAEIPYSSIYNLGSGKTIKIKEVVELIYQMIKPSFRCDFGSISYHLDQIYHLEADISKLKKDSLWTPKITIEEGLLKTIDFYKQKFMKT